MSKSLSDAAVGVAAGDPMSSGQSPTYAYDAFMSYSHALDGLLAPRLQADVERFASPWYRARLRRVFRDDANLSADPQLWSAIEKALSSSRWLVLLASPEAAGSVWVQKEVDWWLQHRGTDSLLVVLTGGQLRFAPNGAPDLTATNALPPKLALTLKTEPRWVDLRWLDHAGQLDHGHPGFRDNVADIAAAISETPKDALLGEHVRRRRQTRRLVGGVITTLSLLLVASLVAASFAVSQRNAAREQARVATARLLASTSEGLLGTRLDLAQLLAVKAYRMQPGPETRRALFRASTAAPQLRRFLYAGSPITAIDAVRGAAVGGTSDGQVYSWQLESGTRRRLATLDGPVRAVAVSDDARTLVAAAGGGVTVFVNGSAQQRIALPNGQAGRWSAVSPDGSLVAVLSQNADPENVSQSLTVWNSRSGRSRQMPTVHQWDRVAFQDKDVLVLGTVGAGDWQRLDPATLEPLSGLVDLNFGTHNFGNALSRNGAWIGYANESGDVPVWRTAASSPDGEYPDLRGLEPSVAPEAMTISDDGRRLAIAETGRVYVSDLATTTPPKALTLDGIPNVTSDGLVFAGDSNHLLSVSDDRLAVWDLTQFGRVSSRTHVTMEYGCTACTTPALALGPAGAWIATATSGAGDVHVLRALDPVGQVDVDAASPTPETAVWSSDGTRLAIAGEKGGGSTYDVGPPTRTTRWPEDPYRLTALTAARGSGGTLIVVDSAGNRIVRDLATGAVRSTVPASSSLAAIMADTRTLGDLSLGAGGRHFAVVSDRQVVVADLDRGTLQKVAVAATSLQLAAGRLFLRRDDGTVEVWSEDGKRRLTSLLFDVADVRQFAVDSSGAVMASRRSDGSVLLSGAVDGTTVGSIPDEAGPLGGHTGLAFSPDGSHLGTLSSNGDVQVWDVTVAGWMRASCVAAGRDLTTVEWRRYAGTLAPGDLRCNGSDPVPAAPAATGTATSTATSVTTSTATATITRGVPDGVYHAYLRTVDQSVVTYDQVDWFTGTAAEQACREDGRPVGDSALCHDYYIRNKNPMLRTLPAALDASVVVAKDHDPAAPVPVGLDELALMLRDGRLNGETLFALTVKNHRILALEQVFLP